MNIALIQQAADVHRAIAEDLEAHVRAFSGEQPEPEEVDKVNSFTTVRETLLAAMDTLRTMADRESHSVIRAHANRCRVVAKQCSQAIELLDAVGEL